MPSIEDVISGLCLAQTEKLKNVDAEVRSSLPPSLSPPPPSLIVVLPELTLPPSLPPSFRSSPTSRPLPLTSSRILMPPWKRCLPAAWLL